MTDSTTPWDDFLTEQDKAYVDKIGPLPVRPFGLRPALLMIDHCNYATVDHQSRCSKQWTKTR